MTKEQIKEFYGDDIIFLFKVGNDITMGENNAPMGTLIEKDDKIICYECGESYNVLGCHLRKHNMTSETFREKYGLNSTAPLCGRKYSELRSKQVLDWQKREPEKAKEAYLRLNEGRKKSNVMGKIGAKRTIQGYNQTINKSEVLGSCPAQIEKRLELLASLYGDDLTRVKIDEHDSGLNCLLQKHYGGLNNYKNTHGIKINKGGGVAYEDAKLIYALRDYIKDYGKSPYYHKNGEAYIGNGFTIAKSTYKVRWGSWRKALKHCGIQASRKRYYLIG